MKYITEIIPYIKLGLFAFLVIAVFPIHHLTGSNIQSYIAHTLYGCMEYNNTINVIVRTIIGFLFVIAYQTKDSMLFCLLLFYFTFKPEINLDKHDRHKNFKLC